MKLEVKNLSKKFKDVFAVKNISFNVPKNKTLGLLGPNGCGKTTSIGMMLGLIEPSSGSIYYDGKDINKRMKGESLYTYILNRIYKRYLPRRK